MPILTWISCVHMNPCVHGFPPPHPHILNPYLPALSPSHPSELSQSTSFGCSASCTEFALVIYFTYGVKNSLLNEFLRLHIAKHLHDFVQGKQEHFRSLIGTEESVLSVTINYTAVSTWLITGDTSPPCPSLNLCLIWTPLSFSQRPWSKRGKSLNTCWNLAKGTVSRSAPHWVQTTLGKKKKKGFHLGVYVGSYTPMYFAGKVYGNTCTLPSLYLWGLGY